MEKLIIEAAINEGQMKATNPNVPYSPEEVARDAEACVKAGASIIHFHDRDAKTGETRWNNPATYSESMRLVRKRTDAICYPTYHSMLPREERFKHFFAMADDPTVRLELTTVDAGAVLMGRYDPKAKSISNPERVSANTHADVLYLLQESKKRKLKVVFGIREPGGLRHIEAYCSMGLLDAPVLLKFFLVEDVSYGLPYEARSLQLYADLVPKSIPVVWFVQGYGSRHFALNTASIAMGGHARTGLGDLAVLDGKKPTNADLVARIAEVSRSLGRDVATPKEAREILGLAKR